MKLLLSIGTILSIVAFGGTAVAQPKLCSMSASYRAVYEYPTGTYWVNQISNSPAYYTAHNAFYMTKYGCS